MCEGTASPAGGRANSTLPQRPSPAIPSGAALLLAATIGLASCTHSVSDASVAPAPLPAAGGDAPCCGISGTGADRGAIDSASSPPAADLRQFVPPPGALSLSDIDLDALTIADLAAESNPLAGCVICHVPEGDAFARSIHERRGVGCTGCHGPSIGHVADENNNVLPDEVFARPDVDRRCRECHDCSRAGAEEYLSLPLAERLVCTECHGAHRIVRFGSPEALLRAGGRMQPPP